MRGRVDLLGEGVDQGAPAVAVHKEERAARGRGDEAGDIVCSGGGETMNRVVGKAKQGVVPL